MDLQSNEPRELDDQEKLAREYALSESARYRGGMGQPPKKKGPGFGLGILLGSAFTLLLVTVALLSVWALLYSAKPLADSGGTAQEQKDTKSAILNSSVEKKAGELTDLIDQYYYEAADKDALIEGIYAGMVEGLGDPYSAYFSAEEYASFNESTTGVYQIGQFPSFLLHGTI